MRHRACAHAHSPLLRSYGSGFSPRPDGTRCSWDLTRLIENPGNVLRAINSCLPGVTQCVPAASLRGVMR